MTRRKRGRKPSKERKSQKGEKSDMKKKPRRKITRSSAHVAFQDQQADEQSGNASDTEAKSETEGSATDASSQ
eukprot:8948058-Karenia_brevis.AAC.1